MTAIRRFFAGDAAGAIVLLAATIAALIVANSPLAPTYVATLHHAVGGMSVEHWINDGAMALFFLLIGLEVKSEFVSGHLSTWGERIMPGAAALAGMAVPAALLRPSLWVAEIVYFPLETELLRTARALGCRTAHGGGMAVFQAVEAFRHFTGLAPDAARMTDTFLSFDR